MDYVESGFLAVAEHLEGRFGIDRKVTKARFLDSLIRNGRGRIFDDWIHEERLNEFISASELVDVYRSHLPNIALYPDVEPILNKLKSLRISSGIITDGCLKVQMMKIKTLGLSEIMDNIVCTDAKGGDYSKPNPRVFLDMLERLRIPPNESIYIGNDPAKDFKAPRVIGMYSAHISRSPIGTHTCEADYHIMGLGELADILNRRIY